MTRTSGWNYWRGFHKKKDPKQTRMRGGQITERYQSFEKSKKSTKRKTEKKVNKRKS